MWGSLIAGAAGAILKSIPWGTVFEMIFKAVLTNEKAKKAFLEFVGGVPQKVPVEKQDEYITLREQLKKKVEEHV